MKRRYFLSGSLAATATSVFGEVAKESLSLGYDNFAVRAMDWKAKELIDYAVKLKVDTVFITDLDAFQSLDEKHLLGIRKYADDLGIKFTLEPGAFARLQSVSKISGEGPKNIYVLV
jgi:hypothetical protein